MYRFFSFLMVALSFALLGCGLEDYEKRMDIQKRRMKIFDDEDRALDAPLETPVRLGKDKQELPAWPFEVFVRPIKGISTKEAGTSYKFNNLILYRFPAQIPADKVGKIDKIPVSVLVACMKVGQKNKDGTFMEGELSIDEFHRQVRGALKDFYQKEFKGDITFPAVTAAEKAKFDKITIQPEGIREELPALEYERLVFEDRKEAKDPTHFLLYFHQQGGRQIALIYQVPKKDSTDANFLFSLDYSLKSLDISDRAPERRQEYLTSRKK